MAGADQTHLVRLRDTSITGTTYRYITLTLNICQSGKRDLMTGQARAGIISPYAARRFVTDPTCVLVRGVAADCIPL